MENRASVMVDGDLVENEWPFTIQLIPRRKLFADSSYQRPPQVAFINKLAAMFDPTLVATLDVSARDDGMFAILDGLQRNEVLDKMGIQHVWCAVYEGMELADEARFFYRRNRDRKSVHPFYQFRARVLMGEGKAQAIDRIVRSEGFLLHTSAGPDDYLAAIRASRGRLRIRLGAPP